MSELRAITHIIIHCSDSPNARNFTVKDVDQWHQERGFHRDPAWVARFNPSLLAIGYHFFIDRIGCIYAGRHINEIGSHVKGANEHSIGICLCGKDIFTDAQIATLKRQVVSLLQVYPNAEVCGHYEFPSAIAQGKTCPNFNVRKWWEGEKLKMTAARTPTPPLIAPGKENNPLVALVNKLLNLITGR